MKHIPTVVSHPNSIPSPCLTLIDIIRFHPFHIWRFFFVVYCLVGGSVCAGTLDLYHPIARARLGFPSILFFHLEVFFLIFKFSLSNFFDGD
jgi:hypothetical protein